jgi:tetratricopeptide (TPR) repeat protein
VSTDSLEIAKTQYWAGKTAFERGEYRQSIQSLEKAVSLSDRNTLLGGEMQVWLATAYEAAGEQEKAIALCEQLSKHPHLETRKQGKRLLYIYKAPRLKTRPEWLTEIPDLTALDSADQDSRGAAQPSKRSPRPQTKSEPEPIDLSQVNTEDNKFIWAALVAIALILGSFIGLTSL